MRRVARGGRFRVCSPRCVRTVGSSRVVLALGAESAADTIRVYAPAGGDSLWSRTRSLGPGVSQAWYPASSSRSVVRCRSLRAHRARQYRATNGYMKLPSQPLGVVASARSDGSPGTSPARRRHPGHAVRLAPGLDLAHDLPGRKSDDCPMSENVLATKASLPLGSTRMPIGIGPCAPANTRSPRSASAATFRGMATLRTSLRSATSSEAFALREVEDPDRAAGDVGDGGAERDHVRGALGWGRHG